MSDFVICALFVAGVLLAFLLFDMDIITPEEMSLAEQLCVNNGGVKHVDLDTFASDVLCNDGAFFEDGIKYYKVNSKKVKE